MASSVFEADGTEGKKLFDSTAATKSRRNFNSICSQGDKLQTSIGRQCFTALVASIFQLQL